MALCQFRIIIIIIIIKFGWNGWWWCQCFVAGSNPVTGDTEEVILKRLRSIFYDEDIVSGKCRSGQ